MKGDSKQRISYWHKVFLELFSLCDEQPLLLTIILQRHGVRVVVGQILAGNEAQVGKTPGLGAFDGLKEGNEIINPIVA
jgi:hypothetical protein